MGYNMRKYEKIGGFRLLNIEVYYDEKKVYTGAVEDAPEEIKQLEYSKVELGDPTKLYVYSDEFEKNN